MRYPATLKVKHNGTLFENTADAEKFMLTKTSQWILKLNQTNPDSGLFKAGKRNPLQGEYFVWIFMQLSPTPCPI